MRWSRSPPFVRSTVQETGVMTQLVTGFTVSKLIQHLKSKEINLAEALNDTPCLVFHPFTGNQSPLYNSADLGKPISSIFKLSETDALTQRKSTSQHLNAQAVIAPLWKSDRNSFKEVSVGRSSSCDIRISSPQVSKIHALFTKDAETGIWSISDNRSTNGTRVNNNLLQNSETFHLDNNAEISLGELRAIFLTREGLVALCSYVEGQI